MSTPLHELAALADSDDLAALERAFVSAATARDPAARTFAARAYDRSRALRGEPQKFGTQAVLRDGHAVVWPVAAGTTDSERAKWGLDPLAALVDAVATAPRIDKQPLRRLLRERRRTIDERDGPERAQRLAENGVAALAAQCTGRVVATYWPIRGEADPRPLAAALERAGAELALPRVDGERLVFHRHRAGEALVPAGFGTFGPAPAAEVVQPDVVLVPLLGFDSSRARLGRGGGHYDRSLGAASGALAVGVAFAEQQLPLVPTEPHDRSLALVLTDHAVLGASA